MIKLRKNKGCGELPQFDKNMPIKKPTANKILTLKD